jgi:DNA-binding MarR family transcriptional regulator
MKNVVYGEYRKTHIAILFRLSDAGGHQTQIAAIGKQAVCSKLSEKDAGCSYIMGRYQLPNFKALIARCNTVAPTSDCGLMYLLSSDQRYQMRNRFETLKQEIAVVER